MATANPIRAQLPQNPLIENILQGTTELAVIIRASYVREGITFLTPNEYSQQLGYMNRRAGHRIPAHIHNAVPRSVTYTREVLFVKSGRLRVDLYGDDGQYAESCILNAGDVILLAAGGHGFEMLEDTEMIEVKQGPYTGDQDKTLLEPVEKSRIRIRG
jgi:mannose-6-phosphate isomerase-like protein (cupin superfamily)